MKHMTAPLTMPIYLGLSLTQNQIGHIRPPTQGLHEDEAADYMITCLIEGMKKAVIKPVTYNKLLEITQDFSENPTLFQARLAETMHKYTNLNPKSPEGLAILAVHLTSQASPDIRHNSKTLNRDPKFPLLSY